MKRSRIHYSLRALAWFVAIVLCGSLTSHGAIAQGRPAPSRPAPSAPAAPMASKVSVEIMVVHASNKYDRTDAALAPVMKHLRFLQAQYSGFKLLSKESRPVAVGGEHTFSVVGGRRVKVNVVERNPSQVKVRIRMFNESGAMLDTTVSIHRNKSFMVGGPKYDDGVLILPLTARY
jgi:hypothetical protein